MVEWSGVVWNRVELGGVDGGVGGDGVGLRG